MVVNCHNFRETGVRLLVGGLATVLSFPPTKEVEYNDWAEEDGIQPDLSNLKLDARQYDLTFGFDGVGTATSFYESLMGSVYHTFDFGHGITRKLRIVSMTPTEVARKFLVANVVVSDDNPWQCSSEGLTPRGSLSRPFQGSIDGIDFRSFGIRLLKGMVASALPMGAVKPLLERNISSMDGVIYDAKGVHRRSGREVVLPCLLVADNEEDAWHNYYALLSMMMTPHRDAVPTQEYMFRVAIPEVGFDAQCYYKSCSVTDFTTSGNGVWLMFDLTLAVVKE